MGMGHLWLNDLGICH